MMNVSLKQTNSGAISAALSCAWSVMTGRNGRFCSFAPTGRTMSALCRSGYLNRISGCTKGKVKAEQQQLNSPIKHCLTKARSIMRQKRRKAQPESTVHKDMAREEFARAFNPQVADRLRQILEAKRRAGGGHE